jgi:hypothetical protein
MKINHLILAFVIGLISGVCINADLYSQSRDAHNKLIEAYKEREDLSQTEIRLVYEITDLRIANYAKDCTNETH